MALSNQKKYEFKRKIPEKKDLPENYHYVDEFLEFCYPIDEFSGYLVNKGIMDKLICEMEERSEVEFLIIEYEKNNIIDSPLFDEIIKSDEFKNKVKKKTDYLWKIIVDSDSPRPFY